MNSTTMVFTVIGSRFLLNLSALALIVGAIICLPAEQAPIKKGVRLIRNELDIAHHYGGSSSITFDNLKDAYSESDDFFDMKFKIDFVNEIRERRPTIELTINLLGAMRNQYNSIVTGTSDSSPEARKEFIERLEIFYRSLLDEYQTNTTYERPCVKSEKADVLIQSLLELGDSKPLSRELIQEAKREYDEQIILFNKIRSTDLPQETYQLDARVNYLNMDETELLTKLVFPYLEQPDPIDFADLKYNFTDAFENLNYQIKGNRLIDISKYTIARDDFDLTDTTQQAGDLPEAKGASSGKSNSE